MLSCLNFVVKFAVMVNLKTEREPVWSAIKQKYSNFMTGFLNTIRFAFFFFFYNSSRIINFQDMRTLWFLSSEWKYYKEAENVIICIRKMRFIQGIIKLPGAFISFLQTKQIWNNSYTEGCKRFNLGKFLNLIMWN